MAQELIPEHGWHPMVDAAKDVNKILVAKFHEHNKSTGPLRVQFIRWSMNPVGEWAWRPAWRADGGTVYADGFMTPAEYQRAAEELFSEATPEFDL